MTNLPAKILQALLKNSPKLTYLCLERSIQAVNDATLSVIAKYCPMLKTLSLSHCNRITDAGIMAISGRLRDITELSLAHCYNLSSEAISKFVQQLPGLSVVALECNKD